MQQRQHVAERAVQQVKTAGKPRDKARPTLDRIRVAIDRP
jgi:hypothetical protein